MDHADTQRRHALGEVQAAADAANRLRAALDTAEPQTAGTSPEQTLSALTAERATSRRLLEEACAADRVCADAEAALGAIEVALRTASDEAAASSAGLGAATLAEVAAAERAALSAAELAGQLRGAPDLPTAIAVTDRTTALLDDAAHAAEVLVSATVRRDSAVTAAERSAAAAGFAGVPDARDAVRDSAVRAELARRIAALDADHTALEQLLASPDLEVSLHPAADVEHAEAEVTAARAAHDEATAVLARAAERATNLAELAPLACEAIDLCGPLDDRAHEARTLADLASGQGGSGNTLRMSLAAYVLAARLEQVAAAASERLLRMSAGRYSLVHTDIGLDGRRRAGLGLLARDAWTGIDRDTSTLSGGETFLASLALALGLADVVGAESGGARIDTLFVDEGFGSLDEAALDEVMDVLDGLREGGRIVGLVSHVTELRQRIPAQLHVRKTHAGSEISLVGCGASI